MMDFQEWVLRLYLDRDLHMSLIKLQAARNMGRSYAGLTAFVEGMFHLGFISKEVYEEHLKKYSEELVAKKKPPTKEQLEEQVKLQELERQFSGVLKTGLEKLSEKARKHWIQKARENPDVPNARRILELASEKGEE